MRLIRNLFFLMSVGTASFYHSISPAQPRAHGVGKINPLNISFDIGAMLKTIFAANKKTSRLGQVEEQEDCSLGLGGLSMTIEDKWPSGVKTMDEIEHFICRFGAVTGDFCSVFSSYRRQVEAAAAATDLPPQALACVILIESQFRPGLTSPAGARGLAQFMPGTATYAAQLIRTQYAGKWQSYQADLGSKRTAEQVTGSAVRGHTSMSDIEIFASAVYLRDIIKPLEMHWAGHLSKYPGDINKIFDYAVAGYNAGPGNGAVASYPGKLFNSPGASMLSGGLPGETRNYLVKFRDCMGKGVNSFGERDFRGREGCPLQPNGGVCP